MSATYRSVCPAGGRGLEDTPSRRRSLRSAVASAKRKGGRAKERKTSTAPRGSLSGRAAANASRPKLFRWPGLPPTCRTGDQHRPASSREWQGLIASESYRRARAFRVLLVLV